MGTANSGGRGFQNIIVAFDGSRDSVKAVQIACRLASKMDSKLTIAHVYNSPTMVFSGGPGMPIPNYSDLEDAAKASGEAMLSRGVKLASEAGVKARGELLEASSVVEALVRFAGDQKADLVVVGTRGMTGFKKLIVGSVSSGLVGHAHCAVLVVR